MVESYFNKLANDLLETSEKLVNGVEEGMALLFSGDGGAKDSQHHHAAEGHLSGEENDDTEWKEMEEDLLHSSPLGGIAESVIGNIMEGQKAPDGFIEHFHAFRHAITWTEPFVIGILAFHVVMFLFTVWASRKQRSLAPRVILMLVILGIVRMAETLNDLGAKQWRLFATQNYFDRRGIFVSIMLCAPLLLDSLLMMLLFLREASQLLIEVKTAQIRRKQKPSIKREKGGKQQSKKDHED